MDEEKVEQIQIKAPKLLKEQEMLETQQLQEYSSHAFVKDLKESIERTRKEALLKKAEVEKQEHAGEIPDITADVLLSTKRDKIPTLIDPIIPQGCLVALFGATDNGKSTFCRQLCMCVASGTDFVGFKTTTTDHHCIYVSTEDDDVAIQVNMGKQQKELNLSNESLSNITFMFETDNLLDRLEQKLKEKPTALVVIDCFADVYTGEPYQANKVREFLKPYHTLAIKYNTTIMFSQHANKNAENNSPHKNNANGSGGFEGKCRAVYEFRSNKTNPDKKYLCAVKGNYLPSSLKQYAYDLTFNENLVFTATGTRTAFENINKESIDIDKLERDYKEYMSLKNSKKTNAEIGKMFGISEGTVRYRINKYEQYLKDLKKQEEQCIKEENNSNIDTK